MKVIREAQLHQVCFALENFIVNELVRLQGTTELRRVPSIWGYASQPTHTNRKLCEPDPGAVWDLSKYEMVSTSTSAGSPATQQHQLYIVNAGPTIGIMTRQECAKILTRVAWLHISCTG